MDNKIKYYIYNKVFGTNSVDVYVSIVAFEYKNKKYEIYSYDKYHNELYQKVDSEIFFDLDESNYDLFSKYRIHFIKKDNKYYFDSVRKV